MGLCIGDLTASTKEECEAMLQIGEWKINETLGSTWALFFLQAINYPILWLSLTAVENSFLRAYLPRLHATPQLVTPSTPHRISQCSW